MTKEETLQSIKENEIPLSDILKLYQSSSSSNNGGGYNIKILSGNDFVNYITNSDLNGNITIQNTNTWHGENTNVHSIAGRVNIGKIVESIQTNYQNIFDTKMNMNNETFDSSCHMRFSTWSDNAWTYPYFIYIGYSKDTYYYVSRGYLSSSVINYAYSYISFRPCLNIV